MPSWISDEWGKWHPAKETAGLKNISDKPIVIEMIDDDGKKFKKTVQPGGDYVYEGPDRAALYQWWEENGKPDAKTMKKLKGDVTFGDDFRKNNEFLEQYAKYRNMFGFQTVEEYLKYIGFDAEEVHKSFEEKASIVATHDLPNRIPESKQLGGGKDYAGGKLNRYGGFGEPEDMPTAR